MAGAFQCMFIRGAIFTLTKKHGSNKAARNVDLKTIFRHLEFKHDNMLYTQCTRLVDVMSRRWNGVKSRDEFVARFSADKATRLDVAGVVAGHGNSFNDYYGIWWEMVGLVQDWCSCCRWSRQLLQWD